ncbi:MAG: sirohydrochlorin chelatase [Limnospira sp.]
MQSTIFLVSHGSRDPRPQYTLEQLARELGERLTVENGGDGTSSVVGAGVLELAPIPLSEQIRQFGEYSRSLGANQIQIFPLFLLPGVHVCEDIPAEVAIAQQSLGSALRLDVKPYLGTASSQLAAFLKRQMDAIAADAWILLSHGSRYPGGNQPVEHLAAELRAIPAYWSVPPDLESRVRELVETGYGAIGIIPYFIFSGRTTDAIADWVAHLEKKFPNVRLHLTPPLDDTDSLGDLIWILMQSSESVKTF